MDINMKESKDHQFSNELDCYYAANNSNMENLNSNKQTNAISNEIPAQIEKHLDFIESNTNGHILLGSSNLTGRYWCGSVWFYTDPTVAPDINGSRTGVEFSGGVTDCAFIAKDRAIVTEDGGIVNFITIKNANSESPQILKTHQIDDHGYSVTSVKITSDNKTAITASMDQSIRIWDCQTTVCSRHFTPAHTQEVTSISTHPVQPSLFLSSSIDGNVLLWDLRCPKPASCVFRNVDDCPSCVCWLETDDSKFVTGTLSGQLCLRSPNILTHSISSCQMFKRPIYRIQPNKNRLKNLAVCANDAIVKVVVVEDEEIRLVYNSDQHTDFVRGLTWLDEHMLATCGWDKKVFFHSVA